MDRGPLAGEASGRPVDERGYLASHPPERHFEGALDEIRRRVTESGRRVAVLDDDPTLALELVGGAGRCFWN